jgi:hypothetical protein
MISFDSISEPLQVILAANINSRLRGFGISFSSAKVDLDSNNLSDLAVGKKMSLLIDIIKNERLLH